MLPTFTVLKGLIMSLKDANEMMAQPETKVTVSVEKAPYASSTTSEVTTESAPYVPYRKFPS